MLLSDRDIRAEIKAGRLGLDPYDESLVQPSSVDVRLDRLFRVFENHKYPHIDPAEPQDDLTRLVETQDDEPFILRALRPILRWRLWAHGDGGARP